MSSFKKYRQNKKPVITETTVPEEFQHHAESWDHGANLSQETHDKMFAATGGKNFTSFPLTNNNHDDMDSDVAEHLVKHNYQVKDYIKGIATTKKHVGDPERGIPMREKHVEEKIGSVLERTGASDAIKKAYMNDPARAASKGVTIGGGHHVVITHGALGISGMSTGTSWRNQSCMNQDGGGFHRKLSDDSENGTHVAYLVHHDDVNAHKFGEPDNPIARIAIKPYHEHEDDHSSDTIFRPETKTYGSGNTAFENAVSHWTNKHYPAKDGVEYTKNNSVYDDTGNTHYKSKSKEDVENAITSGSDIVDRHGAGMDKDVIDHAISFGKKHIDTLEGNNLLGNKKEYAKENFVRNMSAVGNLNTHHVAALVNMSTPESYGRDALARHHGDKFSTNAIGEYIGTSGTKDIPNRMLMNTKLPSSVVDQLPTNKYSHVRRSVLKPHHYDKVVDSYLKNESGSYYNLNDHAAFFDKSHIDKLVDGVHQKSRMPGVGTSLNVVINTATNSKHFTQEQHDKLVSAVAQRGGAYDEASTILRKSKFASLNDADRFHSTYAALSANENISSDTQKKIKDKLVENASIPHDRQYGIHDIKGFMRGTIPQQISKHMTSEDHTKLAESGKNLEFADVGSSEKHLNSLKKIVTHADDDLANHIDEKRQHHEDNDLPEYDHTDGNDHVANGLEEKLHNHIANYSRAIDNHIDIHVADGKEHSSEIINNGKQADVAEHHLNHINGLSAYKTPDNSYEHEREHHTDHVMDVDDRMHRLRSNTEDHEERHQHDW